MKTHPASLSLVARVNFPESRLSEIRPDHKWAVLNRFVYCQEIPGFLKMQYIQYWWWPRILSLKVSGIRSLVYLLRAFRCYRPGFHFIAPTGHFLMLALSWWKALTFDSETLGSDRSLNPTPETWAHNPAGTSAVLCYKRYFFWMKHQPWHILPTRADKTKSQM